MFISESCKMQRTLNMTETMFIFLVFSNVVTLSSYGPENIKVR